MLGLYPADNEWDVGYSQTAIYAEAEKECVAWFLGKNSFYVLNIFYTFYRFDYVHLYLKVLSHNINALKDSKNKASQQIWT